MIPKHVAIIMDGNGRWAKVNNLSVSSGHKEGAKRIEDIAGLCSRKGIEILTLYAFSTENWKRPREEITDLMKLLYLYLTGDFPSKINESNIVFRVIGNIKKLSSKIQNEIKKISRMTKNNTGLILNLALNYGARDEIIRAVNKIYEAKLDKPVTEEQFGGFLDTKGLVDPDLLIRTGGDMRVSNFLLWQIAYSEIYVTDALWPDFNEDEFEKALDEYSKRSRRYGTRN